jgi:hypothetical protein
MTAGPAFRSERCPCGRRWEHCPRRTELEFSSAVPRMPPSAILPVMPKGSLPAAVFLLALAATPAVAAHCPQGQIWRIRLDQCVDASSWLARPYVRQTRPRPTAVHHVADADAPPYPLPPPAPQPPALPPAPSDDQATLVLPDIEDGAPAIWRLCQAAPNLCKPSDR